MIKIGSVFSTPFETGCVALTSPDQYGMFDGRDSDGVTCGYMVTMVTEVDGCADVYAFTSNGKPMFSGASLYHLHVLAETWMSERKCGARVDITLNGEPFGYITRKAPKSIKFAF